MAKAESKKDEKDPSPCLEAWAAGLRSEEGPVGETVRACLADLEQLNWLLPQARLSSHTRSHSRNPLDHYGLNRILPIILQV